LHEGLQSHKYQLQCPLCGHTLSYDRYGLLGCEGIDEHFLKQEARVRHDIDQHPNYQIECAARLMSFRNQKLVEVGQGILTLKPYIYHYQGTVDGSHTTLTFKVRSTPTLPSDIGRNVQIYEGDTIYQFEMDTKWIPTKMVHVGEYLYLKEKKTSF
jgi:hypothetical protein